MRNDMTEASPQNPYETLGISKQATQDEIKSAYRNLAKKLHPDLNPGNKQAEHKFKDLSQAYEWIGTPEERAKFDRGEIGPEAHHPQGGAPHGHSAGPRSSRGPFYYQTQQEGGRYSQDYEGFDDSIFETIFGGKRGGRGRASTPPPEDQVFTLEIPLEDSVLGATRQLKLPSGKTLEVKIPPGIDTGGKLRFRGLGAGGGDLYVEMRVKPSERFRRVGKDILLELPISLAEAILGGEIEVPTLDGAVRMKVPAGVNTGSKLRVRGKGVRGPGTPGDEIVELKVMLPKEIDPELREAIARWSETHPQDVRKGDAA